MDCSSPGSSVHGDAPARILEWIVMPSSRGSSQPRNRTQVSHMQLYSLPSEPPRKPGLEWSVPEKTAQGWCLASSSCLAFTLETNLQPCQHHYVEDSVIDSWGTPRKGAAGGNFITGRLGDQVTFPNSSGPEGLVFWRCTWLGLP